MDRNSSGSHFYFILTHFLSLIAMETKTFIWGTLYGYFLRTWGFVKKQMGHTFLILGFLENPWLEMLRGHLLCHLQFAYFLQALLGLFIMSLFSGINKDYLVEKAFPTLENNCKVRCEKMSQIRGALQRENTINTQVRVLNARLKWPT